MFSSVKHCYTCKFGTLKIFQRKYDHHKQFYFSQKLSHSFSFLINNFVRFLRIRYIYSDNLTANIYLHLQQCKGMYMFIEYSLK